MPLRISPQRRRCMDPKPVCITKVHIFMFLNSSNVHTHGRQSFCNPNSRTQIKTRINVTNNCVRLTCGVVMRKNGIHTGLMLTCKPRHSLPSWSTLAAQVTNQLTRRYILCVAPNLQVHNAVHYSFHNNYLGEGKTYSRVELKSSLKNLCMSVTCLSGMPQDVRG